jgi:F-type H+-transporting ATPase subunit epsilon
VTLRVDLVSAEATVWSGGASRIIARTTEGDMGVLTGHAPVLAVLKPGQVRIVSDSGEQVVADVEGGFMSVDHDRVTIVSDRAFLTGTGSAGR